MAWDCPRRLSPVVPWPKTAALLSVARPYPTTPSYTRRLTRAPTAAAHSRIRGQPACGRFVGAVSFSTATVSRKAAIGTGEEPHSCARSMRTPSTASRSVLRTISPRRLAFSASSSNARYDGRGIVRPGKCEHGIPDGRYDPAPRPNPDSGCSLSTPITTESERTC